MTSPKPSCAASSDGGWPLDDLVLDGVRYLAERNLYAFIWCGEDMRVCERFGALGDIVQSGALICDALVPLMGFEDQIEDLKRRPDRTIELPNLTIAVGTMPTPRININVYWRPALRRYLVVLSRVIWRSDLEVELNHNIRARRIAESQLIEKSGEIAKANRELARVNADLEEFAYVISHDLNSPLRAMRHMAARMDAELAHSREEGSVNAREILAAVTAQAQRMSGMMSDLLDYASIGRRSETIEEVDAGSLVRSIVATLPRPAGFDIVIDGPWPRLQTARAPLDIVLRNLIDNAIKHHDRSSGTIAIIAREPDADAGAYHAWEIRDDGPGIPDDYRDAVFHPFRKVHDDGPGAADGRDGSGIGLALVKKTIESIGGRLELQTALDDDRGSTFIVFWPKLITV